MIQEIYDMNKGFYEEIKQEYGASRLGKYELEWLHMRYLVYYMAKYDIQTKEWSLHITIGFRIACIC